MKHLGFIILLLSLISASCRSSKVDSVRITALFPSQSDSYIISGTSSWSWNKGEIIGTAVLDSKGMLMTKESYENFRLVLEFYPDSTVNSGIYIRCAEYELSPIDCHEINIWDLHPNQSFRTGAIVTKAIPKSIVNTLGQWNTYTIESIGPRTSVWINDVLTADYHDDLTLKGYIGLQANGEGTIRFRNIRIQQL